MCTIIAVSEELFANAPLFVRVEIRKNFSTIP